MNRLRQSFVVALLVLLTASGALAQSLTGSITGTVKDEQGGALPGVSVTLTGKTGVRNTTTDAEGNYRFPAIPPGTYDLAASLSSFQGKRQSGISIAIGTQLDLDFTLKVGGVTETLDVVGEAPVVDTASSQSANAISQDLLYNMPLNRFAPDLLNYAPGINNGSAFGGGSTAGGGGTGNALLIDGVDTRDPEGGTAWSFFNYNVIQEVQVQGLGAPAEYGAYTGAIVNSITKSGGNAFSGLFDVNYSTDSLAGDNRSSEVRALNPTLEPSKTTKFLDWTAQIGGPIQKDKLFFFLSTQRYKLVLDPNGPRTERDELSHRFNSKLTWLPTGNDTVNLHLNYDDYSITGRPGFDSSIDTNAQTVREDAPEWVWNAQWTHLFGSKTVLEAKYLGWWGYFYLDPEVSGARYYDGTTGGYSDNPTTGGPSSSGNFYYADRGRHEAHASISHHAEAFGQHDLKFGVQVERSRVRSRYGYPTGFNYYDYTAYYPVGQYTAYSYGYDVAGRNRRDSIYVQDSWKPNSRLTINAGARLDWIRGLGDKPTSPDAGKVYDTKSLAPRIGFAFDVTGDHKTVLKAHYGQYYEAAFFTLYQRALPGKQDLVLYEFDGESQEPGGPPGFFEYDRIGFSSVYEMDPDIKHPRVDEFTAGFERALSRDVRLAVTGIWRENKNIVDAVLPDARFAPASFTPSDELAAPFGPIDTFAWVNRQDSQDRGLITNVDGWQYLDENGNPVATAKAYRRYKGLLFVLSKRFNERWGGQISYVLSKTEGTADNRGFGVATGVSNFWKTPLTAVTNSDGNVGYDQRHELKVFASYKIPRLDVGLNAYFRHLSGIPYNVNYRLSSADRRELGYGSTPSSMRTILLEQLGSRNYEDQNIVDFRFEKIFKFGDNDRVAVYADISNAFNSGTVDDVVTRITGLTFGAPPVAVDFEGPVSLVNPRQITLGARWSF